MKKNTSTVIEITASHVKVFQFENFCGKRIMTLFDLKSVCRHTDSEIEEILSSMTRSRNIRPERLMFVVPRRSVIVKQMRLPSQNEEEIRKMVDLQLVNEIPYALEDISYHVYFLNQYHDGHSRVLVIVMHKEVSDRYLKIFNNAGINLNRLILSSFGILEWLEHQRGHKAIKGDGPFAVVDLDVECSEICVCHNRKLLFSRSFDGGAKDLSEDNTARLIKQIELSVNAYQKECNAPPVKEIILLSTLEQVKLLRDKVERDLRISTKVVMPVENVLYRKNMKLSDLKKQSGIALGVGLGLGLADTRKIINLAPQKVYDTKQGKMKKRRWFKFIFLLLLACLSGESVLGVELYQRIVYLNKIKREAEAAKPVAREARRQTKFIQSFNEEFGKRVFAADLVYDLYEAAPPEVSFRSLYLNETRHLTVEGFALTSASINRFQAALVESLAFKDVNLQFVAKRRILGKEVKSFKIDAQLTTAEERKND